MINKRVWLDQSEFNAQLRQHPVTPGEINEVTKEFTLHLMTELAEFLEAGNVFGAHRKISGKFVNRENVRRQLIDIQKYWMSIAQAWGFSREELEKTYWAKSATVRQRFAEEWISELDKPIAVLDLDGVLCDYCTGFCGWFVRNLPNMTTDPGEVAKLTNRAVEVSANRLWIDERTFGLKLNTWNEIQHDFRSSGETARLPVMPYAVQFVQWCHNREWAVVALTSRPIDEYPNLYDDTVQWFNYHKLNVDRIWWGPNKAEKLAAMIPHVPQIKFAVDDDSKFVGQLQELGVRVYWLSQTHENWNGMRLGTHCVKRLEEICVKENQLS